MTQDFRAQLTNVGWVVGVFLGVCLIWEILVKIFAVPEFVLPSIENVLLDIVRAPKFFLFNSFYTLSAALAGFVSAAIIGFALSVAIVSSQVLDRIFMALLALFNSIPKVALAPLFVIWLGTGFAPKVAIAAMMSILLIVVDTVIGMRSVDPEMLNLARVHRASRSSILFKVRLPHALPYIFAAWKTAITLSVIGAIVGEYVAGQYGLGSVILIAQGSFDTPRAFAAVIILGVLTTVLFYTVTFLESRWVVWHVSQRSSHI
jgi:NitT/TauT family transport system permease protein